MKSTIKLADRIKIARSMAGFPTRKVFCSRFNIPQPTLEAWERGKNPLTSKGAKRLVKALKEVGIFCSEDWLREGKGLSPRPFSEFSEMLKVNPPESLHILAQNLKLAKEISTFTALHKDATVTLIRDDSMLPFYEEGDYVGGIKRIGPKLKDALHKRCIIELPNGTTTVRQLHLGADQQEYTLTATNPTTQVFPAIEHSIKIVSAAPIIWHRSCLN